MKIENECYVLACVFNGETLYLTEKYKFEKNIDEALKARNMLTADMIRRDLECSYDVYLDIMPIKITYEW